MNRIQNGLNTATVVGYKTQTVAGGKHVIDHTYPEHKVTDGAFISNPPAQNGMIFEGDLGQFDYNTNVVKHLKVFVAHTAAASAATSVLVKAGEGYHVPEVGEVIMVAPSNFSTGTGNARAITAVELHATGAYYTLTVAAFDVAIAEGAVLVEGVEAGDGKAPLVVPNVVFPQDIYIYEVPAATYNAATGFKYYTSLYDACAILGRKLTVSIPAGARVALRTGYSDVKIVE